MPGLYFDSGIDKGFENDLKRMNSKYNSFSGNVQQKNDVMSKSFRNLAVTVGAAFSVGQIVRFGKDSVNLYRQQQKALSQVEQGLKSTGYASGKTFEQLKKDAADLQKTTLFGDEDILQNATAQLLTFTNIADDNFTRTQKAALDLATRLDGDLKSASIQLGKALNDPVANLSALSRSGIQFSEDQKGLIKSLAETGRLAEAQTIILDELEKQYGGSAAAAAKADGGFTQLANTFGDVQETLGGVTAEGLQPFIEELRDFFASLSEEDIRDFIENVKDAAQVIGILITAITAWKAGLLIMNQIQKINTALTALNTQAQLASAKAGKQVSAVNVLMANSMKKLKAAFAANPIGLIATALTIAIPLIKSFTEEISDATYVQQELASVNKEAEKSIAPLQVKLNQLVSVAKDENATLANRKEAIRQLNEISPEYLGNLNLQNINTKEAAAAVEAYTASLLKQARILAATQKLVEVEKQIIDVKQKSIKESTNVFEVLNDLIAAGFSKEEAYKKIAETSAKNKAEEEAKLIKLREQLLKITTDATNQEITLSQARGKTGVGSKSTKKALKAFQKLLDEQKKAYEDYNKDIEGLTGDRLKIVEKEYAELTRQGKNYLDFLNNLLAEETDAKKQTIIKREIDVTTLQNTILEQKAAQELFEQQKKDLQELEEAFRNYSQKREAIEKEYNKKILKLRDEGFEAQAVQAEKALKRELKRLEESTLQQNAVFQEWVSEGLPKIAAQGVAAIKAELDKVELALQTEGLDPEQVLAYREQIRILQQELQKKLETEKQSPTTWKDTLEILNRVNQLVRDMTASFDFLNESTKRILKTITDAVSGVINLAFAFKAIKSAVNGLERATAILAVISATMQVINTISGLFTKDTAERNKRIYEQAKAVQRVNIELIKQNALYKEGNELFASDKWGTALTGLNTYNEALAYQNEVLQRVQEFTDELFSRTAFYDQLAINTFGDLREITDEFGNLDRAAIQAILDSKGFTGQIRADLEALLETADILEQSFDQFGNYISGIFGNVSDIVAEAFQDMYEGGADAMQALEVSFSEMIEKFTRDALEFAFLQPYINELNLATKELGEQFARGEISSQQLQTDIINTLGGFYDQMATLQPEILQAFQQADQIAEAAGFASAFNPEDVQDEVEDIIIEPEINIPDIEIPEIVIDVPEVVIEDTSSRLPEPARTAPQNLIEGQNIVNKIEIPDVTEINTENVEDVSTPGRISQAITEQTGTVLAGRIGALVLSNEKILLANYDMLDYAIQHLQYMRQVVDYTSYLPQIADNTKKTYEKLESV